MVGVHSGGIDAWYALELTFPSHSYAAARRGVRLRRYDSLEAGVQAYYAERERHGAPDQPRVWVHPLEEDL